MAKRRMISEEILYDREFNSLSIQAQNLFLRMLTKSDDYGIIPGDHYWIETVLNLSKEIKKDLQDYVSELINLNLVIPFDYQDKPFLAMKRERFDDYQNYLIRNRTKSEYLRVTKKDIENLNFPENSEIYRIFGKIQQGCDISYNKIKDKDKDKDKDKEGGVGGENPNQAEVTEYFLALGYPQDEGVSFWNYYESIGWVSGRGQPILNWKCKVDQWMKNSKIFKEENNGRNTINKPDTSRPNAGGSPNLLKSDISTTKAKFGTQKGNVGGTTQAV